MAAYMPIPDGVSPLKLFGWDYRLLSVINARFPDVELQLTGQEVRLKEGSDAAAIVASLLSEMIAAAEAGAPLSTEEVEGAIDILSRTLPPSDLSNAEGVETATGKVAPKTANQADYLQAIEEHTITFGVGPAGSGKTYLAMAKAVEGFLRGDYKRILLSRPVVEAGEHLGFLPGGLEEKLDPYLRPLYDALNEMLAPGDLARLMGEGIIEVAPLAYMRGRTLSNAFVVLDEAQNTSPEQMKMFLTRLGFGSRVVVTGDMSQVDLGNKPSGLRVVRDILGDVEGIAWCDLTSDDVVRHPLVGEIVDAYDRWEAAR